VIIDGESYRSNERLMPDLERLEPHNRLGSRALQVVGPRAGEEQLLAFGAQVTVPGRTRPAS
jgi:hypothetical protein